MARQDLSVDSLTEATRNRTEFSGHGKSLGAAGYRTHGDGKDGDFLSAFNASVTIDPSAHGYGDIRIGAAWENVKLRGGGFFDRMFKKVTGQGVDIDLGCLYELQNGKRGCVQAFGEMFGHFNEEPYINLSGDERTGNSAGDDEFMHLNGDCWQHVKRMLFYVYIYQGAADWSLIKPQIQVLIPGEKPLIVTPTVRKSELAVCAIAGLENVRNGIKLTNYTEYFPGHAEMDRAFGYGIQWEDGKK